LLLLNTSTLHTKKMSSIYEFLTDLGLKKYDLALLIFCPAGAVIGSMAHAILQFINPHKMPSSGGTRILSPLDGLGRMAWLFYRLMLGGILGLVVGLYFTGALQENVTTLAKVIALSILLGFAAPKLWVAQERVIVDQSIKRLNELLRRGEAEHTAAKTSNGSSKQESTVAVGRTG
jgi:hypothetical protein